MNERELILTSILHCRRTDLYSADIKLSRDQQQSFDSILKRRAEGEPLQYLLGECEFMGLTFKVDRNTLIPRPETEILVESVLNKADDFVQAELNILDLGTGSGNIAV